MPAPWIVRFLVAVAAVLAEAWSSVVTNRRTKRKEHTP